MMNFIQIKTINHSELGSLSFFESEKDIPFNIKRVYYTYHVPEKTKRGGHAHKNLQQMLFSPYGSIEVILDNGVEKESVLLDTPSKGLLVGSGMWHDMIWHQTGSVLCAVASGYYEEEDYIRNYDEFMKLVREGYWK